MCGISVVGGGGGREGGGVKGSAHIALQILVKQTNKTNDVKNTESLRIVSGTILFGQNDRRVFPRRR